MGVAAACYVWSVCCSVGLPLPTSVLQHDSYVSISLSVSGVLCTYELYSCLELIMIVPTTDDIIVVQMSQII